MSEPLKGDSARDALPDDCRQQNLGVAFVDLSRLSEWAGTEQDATVAGFLQQFYELTAATLAPAGGRIVKFMGDAGMLVFEPDEIEAAVGALDALARETRALGRRHGFDTYLNVNVHVGPVHVGSFGPPGEQRLDVIGKTVNIAARLGRRGMTLSPQAFRCLGEDARKRFNKLMPPITYRASTSY